MAQRQAAGLELAFQRRPVSAALYACRLRDRVDLEHAPELLQVDGDHRTVGARRLDAADHARTPTPGNGNGVHRITPVENGDDLALVARESHHVRRIGEVARENPGAVEERPAVAVQQPLVMLGRACVAQALRRGHARRAQTDFLRAGRGSHLVSRNTETTRVRGLERAHLLRAQHLGFEAPAPELESPLHRCLLLLAQPGLRAADQRYADETAHFETLAVLRQAHLGAIDLAVLRIENFAA